MCGKGVLMLFFKKMFLQVIMFVVFFIPTWIYLMLKLALNPEGFWQNFLLLGFGAYFLGTIQLFLGVIFLALSFQLWTE
jgi:hypothetical protein